MNLFQLLPFLAGGVVLLALIALLILVNRPMKYIIAIVLICSFLVFLARAQSTVQLTVNTATGTPPFTYKWTKDGVALAATSNPLVISPLGPTDSGSYQATVLNAAGSATSAPTGVAVVAVSSTAPDSSKLYVEAAISAPWSPPVGQWEQKDGYFAVVPLKKVDDPGNHFDDATGIYTVGPGEGGVYTIQMSLRAADMPAGAQVNDCSVGITAGTTNQDVKTGWSVTPSKSDQYLHWGTDHPVTKRFNAGDKIRCNVFVAKALPISNFDVSLRRVSQ